MQGILALDTRNRLLMIVTINNITITTTTIIIIMDAAEPAIEINSEVPCLFVKSNVLKQVTAG